MGSVRADAPADAPTPNTATVSSFIVLPVLDDEAKLDELQRRSVELEDELAARGYEPVAQETAVTLFQERHSREPRDIAAQDVEVLLRESELARRAAAGRENVEAKRYAERVQQRVADRLETANRDDTVARAYFAACWAHVRALVNENDAEGAVDVGRRCVAEIPDLAPRLRDHPPSVMRIYEQVSRELSSKDAAPLEVDSTPPGCRLLVDGRPTATTPARLKVPVAQRYALQVDCGSAVPPRVHDIVTRSTATVLAVDAAFESAVRTSGGPLRLHYERPNDPSIENHARAIGQVLEVAEVFLIVGAERGGLRIKRLDGKSAYVADARKAGVLSAAVNTLLQPDEASSEGPASRAPRAISPEVPTASKARWLLPTGIALAGAAIVVGGMGVMMYNTHRDAADAFRDGALSDAGTGDGAQQAAPDYEVLGTRWQAGRLPPFILAGTASGLMTAAGIMLTEPLSNKTRRWLSPVLAASGIAIGAVGIRDIVQGSPCAKANSSSAHECVDEEEQLNRGGLITIAAAPFVITSLVHFGEWLWRRQNGTTTLSFYGSPRAVGATVQF